MPLTINRECVGKEYPPIAVTVERGRIKEFARALGDANPFHLDDIIAPPTFAITFIRDEAVDTAALLRDLGVDISRVLHGEQEFEIATPIRPGQTYLCRTRITDIYEKTGRSGPMAFVVRETAVVDGSGQIAVTMRNTTVIRL